MSDYVDLHCHYLPAIDDGVKTREDALELLRGLHQAGFCRVVATPHIRTAMFENRRAGLESAFDAFTVDVAGEGALPELGLGAEHFFDDVVWELFLSGELRPYPGDHAVLIEFPERMFPMGVEERFFKMQVRGLTPVLAHPERYMPLQTSSEPLERLSELGALPLLDVMALVGKYGSSAQRVAERLLEEKLYYAACSDSHRPSDAEVTAKAIARLVELRGANEAHELLADHPRHILEGTVA